MRKKITNYTFDASAKTVTFNDYANINLVDVLLITNVNDNINIYLFDTVGRGGAVATNVLTLDYDTTSMDDTDDLLIRYEDDLTEATEATLLIVKNNSDSLVGALNALTATINESSEQKVSVDDMSMMFKRMMQMLERPPYMSNLGVIRAELQSSGTSPITLASTNIVAVGAGVIDQTFTYYAANRDYFNAWKNNIII